MKKWFYYLNIFFIFSVLGYIFETIFIKHYESGILYLPWTPVYGMGILVALLIYQKIKNKYAKIIEILIIFLSSLIILSILECLAGNLIELIFHKVYWNYTDLKFNFGKYIALETALVWGIGSVLGVYLLIPLANKFERYIPQIISYLLLATFIIDVIITLIVKTP